jgi:hypothetical protein
MSVAYSSKNCKFPAEVLASLFLLENADSALLEAKNYGIVCEGKFLQFQRGAVNQNAKLVSTLFANFFFC